MKAMTFTIALLFAASAAGQGPCPGGVCPAPGAHVPGSLRTGQRCTTTPPPYVCRIDHRLRGSSSHGSGTLVANDSRSSYILTCFHLFRDGVGEIGIILPGTESQTGQLVASDQAHDLAIVRTRRVAVAPVRVARGDPVGVLRAAGYGRSGVYGEASGRVAGYSTASGAEYRSLRIAARVEQGDSGGPVFDWRGELAGVVWGELNGEAYATYGIPVWRLVERVTSQSQGEEKPVVSPSPSPQPSPLPVAPPVTPPACNCGDRWQQTSEQLSAIHKQLTGLESRIAALATTLRHDGTSIMPMPSEPPGLEIPWLQIASIAIGISGPAGVGVAAAGAIVMWRSSKRLRGAGGPRRRRFRQPDQSTTE